MKSIRKYFAGALVLAGVFFAVDWVLPPQWFSFTEAASAQNAGQIIASPAGTETVQVNPVGTAANAYVTLPQIRDSSGYSQQTPLTGFTITVPSTVSVLQLTPAGTLATGTVTLPATPVDGQRVLVFSTQTVTALTVSPSAGQTINGTALTTIAANGNFEYLFTAASKIWFRIQ